MRQTWDTTIRALAAIVATLVMAACGGGSSDSPAGPAQRAAAAPLVLDATELMDWAQGRFPQYFPSAEPNLELGPFVYRYYPQTQNYLGVAGSDVYVSGPVSHGALLKVGTLGDFSCEAKPITCPSPPPDTRSGTYTAYVPSGERFTIDLDFASSSYAITGLTVPSFERSGTFTTNSESLHTFDSGGFFRATDGLVVGSFNFASGVQPFVAGRQFAASAAEAAGTYNNLGVNHTAAGVGDSTIYASRIDAGGTLRICSDNIVYTIDLCPAASVTTYALAVSGNTFTATSPGRDTFTFRVALAGTEKIYLMASVGSVTGTRYFRIGVLESAAFGAGTAHGATTLGEQGMVTFSSTSYASNGTAADGHPISLTGSLSALGATGPSGMRVFKSTGNGFAIQNMQLAVLVGARGGSAADYMQIGAK